VTISDSALVAAAALSNRYIPSRQLPDKAIDLIDEAMSRLKMEIDSSPVEIDQLRRRVDRMRLEDLALKKEKDDASKERRAALREQMDAAESELRVLEARWERERAELNRVGDLKKQLDQAYTDRDRALREADYARASKLEYETIKRLEQEVADAERADTSTGPDGEGRMVNEQVTDEDIAVVFGSAWMARAAKSVKLNVGHEVKFKRTAPARDSRGDRTTKVTCDIEVVGTVTDPQPYAKPLASVEYEAAEAPF
jgi:ATP-dependent Clp protease ATP-binding subunit ClpB